MTDAECIAVLAREIAYHEKGRNDTELRDAIAHAITRLEEVAFTEAGERARVKALEAALRDCCYMFEWCSSRYAALLTPGAAPAKHTEAEVDSLSRWVLANDPIIAVKLPKAATTETVSMSAETRASVERGLAQPGTIEYESGERDRLIAALALAAVPLEAGGFPWERLNVQDSQIETLTEALVLAAVPLEVLHATEQGGIALAPEVQAAIADAVVAIRDALGRANGGA